MTVEALLETTGSLIYLGGTLFATGASIRSADDGYLRRIRRSRPLDRARDRMAARLEALHIEPGQDDQDLVQTDAQVQRWRLALVQRGLPIFIGLALIGIGANQHTRSPRQFNGSQAMELVAFFFGFGILVMAIATYREYRNPWLALALRAIALLDQLQKTTTDNSTIHRARLIHVAGALARSLPRLMFRVYGRRCSTAIRELSVAVGRTHERGIDAAVQQLVLTGCDPVAMKMTAEVAVAAMRLAAASNLGSVGTDCYAEVDRKIVLREQHRERRLRYAAASASVAIGTVAVAGTVAAVRILGQHTNSAVPGIGGIISVLGFAVWIWRRAGDFSSTSPDFAATFDELADRANDVADRQSAAG